MKTVERKEGGVAVVRFRGRLDTNAAPAAQDLLDGLLAEGTRKIVVDLAELDYISSAGLRILLATAKKLRRGGGALRFCSLNETVARSFEISGFDRIFDVYPSEAGALEGF